MTTRRSKRPKTPFTVAEAAAIQNAIVTLYKRSIVHLVACDFDLPYLPDMYTSMVPTETWSLLRGARDIMARGDRYYHHEVCKCDMGLGLALAPGGPIAVMRVMSHDFLPDPMKIVFNHALPSVLLNFTMAVQEYQRKWHGVKTVFEELNRADRYLSRMTIAHHWPCVTALLKMGKAPADNLTSEAQRPTGIPGDLSVRLRDTNAFVMQHMMLPPIDNTNKADYQGDAATGVAVCLVFINSPFALGLVFDYFWPLSE